MKTRNVLDRSNNISVSIGWIVTEQTKNASRYNGNIVLVSKTMATRYIFNK